MIVWLRRLFHRRIVRGLENRIKSLEDLMDSMETAQSNVGIEIEKIEALLSRPQNVEEREKLQANFNDLKDKHSTYSRVFWDSYARHEEVTAALMWVIKDFNLR